jgi:tight adherence protein B
VLNAVPLTLAVVGGLALMVALVAVLSPQQGSGILTRLRGLYGEAPEEESGAPPSLVLRDRLQAVVGRRLEHSRRGAKLASALSRADLRLRLAEWLGLVGVIAVAVGALAALRFGSLLAFPIGAAAGYAGCQLFLVIRQSRRTKAFDNALAPTVLAISNGLKAGYTFAQAIDVVSKNTPPPMGSELLRVVRETQLGVPIGEALANMVARNDSEDMRLMLSAVQIQQQVGGNPAQILDSIEGTIRERVRIRGEIKSLTTQARTSGWILMALPFALAGMLSAVAPNYFTPMFKEFIGQVMLGMAGGSLLIGYAIIRKIVNVEV